MPNNSDESAGADPLNREARVCVDPECGPCLFLFGKEASPEGTHRRYAWVGEDEDGIFVLLEDREADPPAQRTFGSLREALRFAWEHVL